MSPWVCLVLAQFATDVFDNPAAFEQLEARGGQTLARRPVKDSAFFEYRAVAPSSLTVPQLCEGLYEWGTRAGEGSGLTLSKLLIDGADLRVLYNQISQPVVARRDYALSVLRERPTPDTCRVRFRVTNEHAPPRPDGFVRMEKMWGEWLMEPTGTGARVTYTLFSDPAGSVPAFLVHGPTRDAARDTLKLGLERAKTWSAKKDGGP